MALPKRDETKASWTNRENILGGMYDMHFC